MRYLTTHTKITGSIVGLSLLCLLLMSGCATPDYRYFKQVKPHAKKGLVTLQTVETGYETIYYSCKKQSGKYVCEKACGDKFQCPIRAGYVKADRSSESRQPGTPGARSPSTTANRSAKESDDSSGSSEDKSDGEKSKEGGKQ